MKFIFCWVCSSNKQKYDTETSDKDIRKLESHCITVVHEGLKNVRTWSGHHSVTRSQKRTRMVFLSKWKGKGRKKLRCVSNYM